MKRLPLVVVSLLLAFSPTAAAQNKNTNTNSSGASSSGNKSANTNRRPIFRANKEQINQAQAILKQRGFYGGEQTGKLDDNTRAGLRKYQEAEGLKITGTLNKVTLEKMGVALTEKQRAM